MLCVQAEIFMRLTLRFASYGSRTLIEVSVSIPGK